LKAASYEARSGFFPHAPALRKHRAGVKVDIMAKRISKSPKHQPPTSQSKLAPFDRRRKQVQNQFLSNETVRDAF